MKTINLKYILAAVLAVLITLCGYGSITASADTATIYSGVLDDLTRDENFDASDYPKKLLDNSVNVIQIAESSAGELFVYCYHPVGATSRLRATSINISTTVKQSLKYENYFLTYINSNGTLYKYKVNDFTVKKDSVRYYDISSIYRKFDSSVDLKPDYENTVSEIAYPVGQFWTACTVGDKVTYNYEDVEVIQVTKQTVGFRRYSNGADNIWMGSIHASAADAHFLAFSCGRQIDRLISADVEFYTQTYVNSKGVTTRGDKVKHFRTLRYDEYAENSGGWLGKKAKWDRIASSDEFLNCGLEFSFEEKEMFSKYDWVLNFYESTFDMQQNSSVPINYWITGDASYIYDISGESVSDVTLMRLEFETEGEIYNLGVVSNKQTGSGTPTNIAAKLFSMPWWGWLILAVIVIIVLGIVAALIKPVGTIITYAVKGVAVVIAAPFKGIAALANAIKNKKQQ